MSDAGHAYRRWRSATRELVVSTAELRDLQDRRYRYAAEVGRRLTEPGHDGAPATGPAVYGVRCRGPGLIYVGQTTESQRRLRDLCIGESHHLANTVPPEVWDQIIVVWWPRLLSQLSGSQHTVIEQLPVGVVGEALERFLQQDLSPVLNTRRRTQQGGWQQRRSGTTGSRAARAAAAVAPLYELVRPQWDHLCSLVADDIGHETACGRTVYPTQMINDEGTSAMQHHTDRARRGREHL